MEKIIKYFCLVFLAATLFTCQTAKRQYTAKPTKSLSNPDSDLLEVNAVAYHVNDSVTSAFLEIKNENLIYKRPDTTLAFYAEVKVSYKLLNEQNGRKVLDSSSFYLADRSDDKVENKALHAKFNLKAKTNENYYLEIDVFDINKKTKYSQGINIYKQTLFSDQNFLITSNNRVAFKNNFLAGDNIVVRYANTSIASFTVECFFKEFGPAFPPFSTKAPDEFKYRPDSIFVILPSDNQFSLTMPAKGFYHVKPDPQSNEGLTLYTYDETFPGVSNSNEMINCTRYIMNREEFETCKNAAEKKAAIDNFWLTIGGSNERAHELLKRYYGRVKEANKNYSNYTQGWKSDRGMIFIVFGTPANIYRSRKDEVWVYGNEANPNSLRFVFNKTKNPFTDNDFIMERSQFYKDSWYSAVDFWRQGNIYLDNKK